MAKRAIEKRDAFPEGYRWQLVTQFRQRAERAADILRTLLVAFSSGAIYFIVTNHYQRPELHLVSAALFVACIGSVLWGWDVQRKKALKRAAILRDDGYDKYLDFEDQIDRSVWLKNYVIDRISYSALGAGIAVEFLIKLRAGS